MTVRFLGSATFNDSPPQERITCESCRWFTYEPGSLAGHMSQAHPGLSPWMRLRAEAAAKGQGLSTAAARARKGLS